SAAQLGHARLAPAPFLANFAHPAPQALAGEGFARHLAAMLVLAIDTALHACAAALLDTSTGAPRAHERVDRARGHAAALMPLIARVMEAGDTPFTHLDRIAVTTGPGSFTGLRVGLSAARGLGLAADRPVIGVTTLSAYAAPHV